MELSTPYVQQKSTLTQIVMRCAVLPVIAGACSGPAARYNTALPGIGVDQLRGQLRIDGRVCIDRGILEYIAVADGGKEYESIFAMQSRPSQLHVAMLLAGYQVGQVVPGSRGDFAPATDPEGNELPNGAPQATPPPSAYWGSAKDNPTHVTIEIDVLQEDGHWKRYPVEYFLTDRASGQQPPRLTWAFTGSFFFEDQRMGQERFVADIEKSLIALYYDPTALLNLTQDAENPYRSDQAGFAVHPLHLPPKGTAVRLILRPAS